MIDYSLRKVTEEVKNKLITIALGKTGGDRGKAARLLQIPRPTLDKYIAKRRREK